MCHSCVFGLEILVLLIGFQIYFASFSLVLNLHLYVP